MSRFEDDDEALEDYDDLEELFDHCSECGQEMTEPGEGRSIDDMEHGRCNDCLSGWTW